MPQKNRQSVPLNPWHIFFSSAHFFFQFWDTKNVGIPTVFRKSYPKTHVAHFFSKLSHVCACACACVRNRDYILNHIISMKQNKCVYVGGYKKKCAIYILTVFFNKKALGDNDFIWHTFWHTCGTLFEKVCQGSKGLEKKVCQRISKFRPHSLPCFSRGDRRGLSLPATFLKKKKDRARRLNLRRNTY